MNFLSFCLFKKAFLYHVWRSFAWCSILSWEFLSFRTLNISSCSLLACFCWEIFWWSYRAPWLVMRCFCFEAFKILFTFKRSDYNVPQRELLWVHLIGVLWASWNWIFHFHPPIVQVSGYFMFTWTLPHSASLLLGLP